jgi:uncharacterized protein YceK
MRCVSSLAMVLVTLVTALGCSAGTTPSDAGSSSGAGGSTGTSPTSASATSGAGTTVGAGGAASTSTAAATTSSATSGAGGSGGAATASASASSGQGGGGGAMDLDAGAGDAGGPPVNAEVYAHSPDTLYRLDPNTKKMTSVGLFGGCGTVIDIALDKNGVMFGTTFGGLYKINKSTAACTLVASGSYPNSLSFVPAGTVDPVNEALVGYNGTQYVRMDTTTGNVSVIGDLGNSGYASSGDLVSLIGGASYLTVNGAGCSDCLVEINPTTGALVTKIGNLNHQSVYGLAYWAGVAYGFDASGKLFQIDVTTAATMDIPIPNAPPGLIFYGAGSTTAAPLHM